MNVYNYTVKKKSKLPYFMGMVGVIVGFYCMIFIFRQQARESALISPLANVVLPQILPQVLSQTTEDRTLNPTINATLEGTTGTYGIVIKNLKTQEIFMQNEHHVFEPASLYKLWVMGAMYEAIEQKRFTQEQRLVDTIENLNRSFDIDPDSAELMEGSISLSVKDALYQMITISHNYAAYLLGKNLRLATVSAYLQKNEFTESSLGEPPQTTAADIALFFEKLYTGKLANPDDTKTMIETLKDQKINRKLPLNLPDSIEIAHKTGELGSFTHDAGIVFAPHGDYIIVVLSESNSPAGAEQRIADISKDVYDYFELK